MNTRLVFNARAVALFLGGVALWYCPLAAWPLVVGAAIGFAVGSVRERLTIIGVNHGLTGLAKMVQAGAILDAMEREETETNED